MFNILRILYRQSSGHGSSARGSRPGETVERRVKFLASFRSQLDRNEKGNDKEKRNSLVEKNFTNFPVRGVPTVMW